MSITVEVLDRRPYTLTENRFGVAKPPTCTVCHGRPAVWVVSLRKLEHTFHEPMCDACADAYDTGEIVNRVRPSAYQIGIAKFFSMSIEEFMELDERDRKILQKFVDAYRKEDMAALEAVIKEGKSLIKQYWQEE